MAIDSIAGFAASGPVRGLHEGVHSAPVSLQDRLVHAFAESAQASELRVSGIEQLLQRADLTSPQVLAQLQEQTGQYNVDINLLNTLVRKVVGTAETLLRQS
ncbi:type III secretion system inner rod subunit SctI [Pseudomonas sp. BJa5]|uniref:type III secretion system inner rod subunit SctI n=1 Tax=Pseudomonas sp. BJa5 TaxID=2936270 RepID=UPI0025594EA5|nr:type III secretion system inner rod subunit SctI [Pseudomonas sp. BGr12]MDL2421186.1 type III secretion system inner rod subunit SctI [Pseudomonas sp. BGr12]